MQKFISERWLATGLTELDRVPEGLGNTSSVARRRAIVEKCLFARVNVLVSSKFVRSKFRGSYFYVLIVVTENAHRAKISHYTV